MAVKCAWASIDERGRASGGKAGDQTGKEVKTGNWYKFGQTAVYRWKDRNKAKQFATIAETLANNSAIGYDQGQRTTLNAELKKIKWNYSKLKNKCECDCSAFVVACVNCTFKKELLSPKLYTGNLGEALIKTGHYTKLTEKKYRETDANLMVGDIIIAPGKHVIICLQDGKKVVAAKKKAQKKIEKNAKKVLKKSKKPINTIVKEIIAGKWGNDPQRSKKLKAAGYTAKEIKKIQSKVNKVMRKK